MQPLLLLRWRLCTMLAMSKLRSVKDVDLEGKKVLLRLDLNVPMNAEGQIADSTRIDKTLPTLNYLLEQGARVIILTHFGRPKGEYVEELKVDKIAVALGDALGRPIDKLDACCGSEVEERVSHMKNGEVLFLENTRFETGEKTNDPVFSKQLAALGDIFVSDAFGVVHRSHASTVGLASYLPAYAGLLLEKEIEILSALLEAPEKPLLLLVGGAKIDTKVGILEKFLELADVYLIGGGMGNTFVCSQGYEVGESLCQRDKLEMAKAFCESAELKGKVLLSLLDAVAIKGEISEDAKPIVVDLDQVTPDMKILDIGPKTIAAFKEKIAEAATIVWNGPMGLYEMEAFSEGTRAIAKAIADSDARSIVGGGDSIDAIKKFGLSFDQFTHVSTGGGAMLEFLQGKELPGVQVLMESK